MTEVEELEGFVELILGGSVHDPQHVWQVRLARSLARFDAEVAVGATMTSEEVMARCLAELGALSTAPVMPGTSLGEVWTNARKACAALGLVFARIERLKAGDRQ